MPNSTPQLERLIKLLGMTGSAHDGEALNAIRLAASLMKQMNLTFEQLCKPAAQAAQASERESLRRANEAFDRGYKEGNKRGFADGKLEGFSRGFAAGLVEAEAQHSKKQTAAITEAAEAHRRIFTECLKFQYMMNGWERGFLASISEWLTNNIPLSDKQSASLSRIYKSYCTRSSANIKFS